MKERSLVAFTLLSQMAVGAFWTLGALRIWAERRAGLAAADALTDPASLMIGPVMVLALLASFFHLGKPTNAWRAFANLRSSWLSREILFATLFTGASALWAALRWIEIGAIETRNVIAWIAALLGLALMFSMANAYEIRTIPAWNTVNTPIAFSITALLLGGLWVGVMLTVNSNASPELLQVAVKWMAWQAVMLCGLELAFVPLWIAQLASGPEAAISAVAKITREHNFIFRLRLALAVLGIVFANLALSPWWQWTSARIGIILAFGVVLIAEVLGRILFYEARVRRGV
jgi:anaerobic dimethyl sulfoxide reductase subunit C (anchor subunit)